MAGVETRWAANHWKPAVDLYVRNHPGVQTVCQDLRLADWSLVPKHDVMLAAPSCTGHTHARGTEKPHHDTARQTAWSVVEAAEYHKPGVIVVENVREFGKWALFPAWCSALTALDYAVSPHLLDAADYGVPQHRLRMVIVCTRSKHPLEIEPPKVPHVAASSVVDFSSGEWSSVDRPGRAANTLARVKAGRTKYGERFVMPYYGSGSGKTGRSLSRPLGTITTVARWAVVDGNRMRMLTVDETRATCGFRDGYALPVDAREAVHMLGNSVPPPLAHAFLGEVVRRL